MAWDAASIIGLITALMPIMDQVVKWIEQLFPKSAGSAKKAVAVSVIDAVMPAGITKGPEAQEVISKMIDERVAALNELGVLKHKKKVKV